MLSNRGRSIQLFAVAWLLGLGLAVVYFRSDLLSPQGASALAALLVLYVIYLLYLEDRQRIQSAVQAQTLHMLLAQAKLNADLQAINSSLRISEAKLAVTLGSIGDGVIATDSDARVTLLNPVAQQLTGWTETEAIGQPVSAVFRILSKATRQPAKIPVAETLAHGTAQGLANHTVLLSRDGQEFDIADSCAPIRDATGEVLGAVLVFRNVTAQYLVEQALRDSSELNQTVLNNMVDGIVTMQATDGKIATTNPAFDHMFGYASGELQGTVFTDLIQGFEAPGTSDLHTFFAINNMLPGTDSPVMGLRKNGGSFPLEMVGTPMQQGTQRYFTAILHDISARRVLDQALQATALALQKAKFSAEKANLAKSEFLSGMSHELRSPLNAILGFAQLMETSLPAPSELQKSNIDQILRAGWYLLELINEILDLSLIESGKLSLSMEPISLARLLPDCDAMIQAQALRSGIHVEFHNLAAAYSVRADRTRVQQVLVNLLSNAVKYNKPHGRVDVHCVAGPKLEGQTQRIRISVRDTGDGLSPDMLAQLFQPFNRLGQESGTEEGTGIGLVVSKRLVELMGGTIGVSSALGRGSEFWFELDRMAPQELRLGEATMAVVPPPHAHTALKTLLYVEDNQANMDLVAQLIARRSDIRLLGAADGIQGIALARKHQPDVILMDINLPGISGLQALQMLQDDPSTSHIPVLALSANAMDGDIQKGLEAGFLRYLTKPIRIDAFMKALDIALQPPSNTNKHTVALETP